MPIMQHEPSLFGVSDHLKRLSDSVEVLWPIVDLEPGTPRTQAIVRAPMCQAESLRVTAAILTH